MRCNLESTRCRSIHTRCSHKIGTSHCFEWLKMHHQTSQLSLLTHHLSVSLIIAAKMNVHQNLNSLSLTLQTEMKWQDSIGFRMCDANFASSDIEWQIIRLGASFQYDKMYSDVPRYAPFVAAGFFFVGGSFLHDVPFDPFVPWVFMGEEISLSLR